MTEVLHALDSIKKRPNGMLYQGRMIDAYEYRAKKILLNISDNRGFTYEEFIMLEEQLEQVEKNLYPGSYFST